MSTENLIEGSLYKVTYPTYFVDADPSSPNTKSANAVWQPKETLLLYLDECPYRFVHTLLDIQHNKKIYYIGDLAGILEKYNE